MEDAIQKDVARMLGSVKGDSEWTVYEINDKNLKLYHDNFIPSDIMFSFFTLQNVSPKDLKVVNEFTL